MAKTIIAYILFIVAGLFLLAAFIIVIRKREGSLKKAILVVIFAILEVLVGCYIQWGFDLAIQTTQSVIDILLPSDVLEDTLDEEHTHVSYRTEKENIVEATCTESGSYELIIYCECEEELNRETSSVEPLGHNYTKKITNPSCTDTGFTTYTCSRCGDSYVADYKDALGHNYENGICIRCGYADPDYVKTYNSEDIMEILSNSVVSDTGTYKRYVGAESISVFANEQYNCFSINTAVSYNLWGGNVQSVIFNISSLDEINILNFDIGGETGSSGSMKVEIFIDKTLEESPDYIYELEASAIPTNASINIKGATSLGIRVTNCSSHVNKMVFFNFSAEDSEC